MDCTIICDCKIANHQHGTRLMYIIHKCRGEACTKQANLYAKRTRLDRLQGKEADRVDAQPVRDHVEYLRTNGVSHRALATASGVSRTAITAMVYGRGERGHKPYPRVLTSTANKILAIKPTMDNMSAGRPIDATGTRRRLQALVTIGYSVTSLGERIGIQAGNMNVTMNRAQVTVATARKVRDLYQQLWNVPNSATTWHALSAANRSRNYAKIHGWLPPMAWDDDQIDDPEYSPVLVLEKGSKIEANREAFLEEVEFFADAGDLIASIAGALGVSQDAVEKRLERYERLDLLKRIGYATKAKAA